MHAWASAEGLIHPGNRVLSGRPSAGLRYLLAHRLWDYGLYSTKTVSIAPKRGVAPLRQRLKVANVPKIILASFPLEGQCWVRDTERLRWPPERPLF
jgi:hypothetical protein